MKQLLQMFKFDLKSNLSGMMGIYMLIVPLIMIIVLRFFLPSMDSTAATLAVVTEGPYAVAPEVVAELETFAKVKRFDSIEDMEQKLRGTGTVEGLYRDPDTEQYVSVLERNIEKNTVFSSGARVIRQLYIRENYPDRPKTNAFTYGVPKELADRSATSPVATMGGAVFLLFMTFISAFIIGLGVVNDKELGTDMALRITPLTKMEYYVGKSILPLLVSAFYAIISLLILGLMHVNILQVYIVVITSFSITLLFGLLIGALAGNDNEAIGIGKMLGMLLMLSVLGGTLLPESWRWIVYWTPFYWVYNVLESVFTQTATWGDFAWKNALIMAICGLYFILLRKKIVKGLS
ncbi:MAG: ABC transporter permease [Candidatus Marinimicrobia bacterium]|nr:ABC transporter permease [Candidatus Neomarinimicrobiota bacterium]